MMGLIMLLLAIVMSCLLMLVDTIRRSKPFVLVMTILKGAD